MTSLSVAEPPTLAPGVELLGEYRDSGFARPSYLIRCQGNLMRVSQLAYLVAAHCDGHRSCAEIAGAVSLAAQRDVSAENVEFLLAHKVSPAGLLAGTSASAAAEEMAVLALQHRRPLLRAALVQRLAGAFAWCFHPVVMAAALSGLVWFDLWLFSDSALDAAVRDAVGRPALFLLVMGITVVSAVFHEIGHAAGCRYSGGVPGPIGGGMYLVWPVLYTNVTDAYRLGRRGRLRTDLGGIYFNGLYVLAAGGAYALSGFQPLLLVCLSQHVLAVQQLIPWVRFDGHFVLSDLTGVPDILSRCLPLLRSCRPGRPLDPRVAELQPRVRRILAVYVVTCLAAAGLLLTRLLLGQTELPTAALHQVDVFLDELKLALGQDRWVMAAAVLVQVTILALPIVGLSLVGKTVAVKLWRGRSAPRPSPAAPAAIGAPLADGAVPRPATAPVVAHQPILTAGTGTVTRRAPLPGGGVVDLLAVGLDGEVVLIGWNYRCDDRGGPAGLAQLHRLAGELAGTTYGDFDRHLTERLGRPLADAMAATARMAGRPFDPAAFEAEVSRRLAAGQARLVMVVGVAGEIHRIVDVDGSDARQAATAVPCPA